MKVSPTHHVTKKGTVKKNPSANVEYALWGMRDGIEQVIRVNGQETQPTLERAKTIRRLLMQRGEFYNIRIQKIDLSGKYDPGKEFARAINI